MAGTKNSGRRKSAAKLELLRTQQGMREIKGDPLTSTQPPKHITGLAAEYWRKIAPTLIETGQLTTTELPVFEQLCLLYARSREATEETDANGLTIPGRQGGEVSNPAYRTERESMTLFLKYSIEFGLTPASRRFLKPKEEKPEEQPKKRVNEFKFF